MYTIHGFFFQKNDMPFVAYFDKVDNGNIMIFSVLVRSIFVGAIGPDPEDEGRLVGFMSDHYGEAELVDVKVDEKQLSFTKYYIHRHDPIFYNFQKKENSFWVGEGTGPAVGHGYARCVLTEVPKEFFVDPRLNVRV